MVQKYLAMVAILGAIATMSIGMVAEAQADGTGVFPCGNGKGFWTCANCDSYQQQPTIQQMDHGYGPGCDIGYHWNSDTGNCVENGYVSQPHIQAVDWGSVDGNLNNPSCHRYSGGSNGGGDDDNAFVQHPTAQQIAYTQVDDGCSGHWAFSFPPRCLSN